MAGSIVYKTFSFLVDTPGTSYNKKFELDKNIKVVSAIMLSSNKPNQLFFRGSQKLEINGEELYPEDYESRLLMSGISVPPNERYVDMGDAVLAGNGEIKIVYKDTDNTLAPFDAYQVILNLKCDIG
ncbi:MAG TPA: hypothetical protein VNB90_15095 [Cytophagaceae bacterium]|jgi:hypothetical protein|nr:hypothetical protein [Cytophagaceae bacterium]